MRYLLPLLFLLLAANPVFADEARPNLKNISGPLLIDAGDAKRMYVTFNHSNHKEIACRNCHHEGLPGNRYASCTNKECHAITAPSSREVLSVYMAYHAPDTKRSCYGCHKPLAGKYPGFKGCSPCHTSSTMRANLEKKD
ncbi:MAG: cytochrome c3 family protein [Desulfovibrio sp.]|nr:cytochrome c3 family protein [Desulfovibrio sp.]